MEAVSRRESIWKEQGLRLKEMNIKKREEKKKKMEEEFRDIELLEKSREAMSEEAFTEELKNWGYIDYERLTEHIEGLKDKLGYNPKEEKTEEEKYSLLKIADD
jgi:hypothetical protein